MNVCEGLKEGGNQAVIVNVVLQRMMVRTDTSF